MHEQNEREQRVNAYVQRKLDELAEEREGDLRVSTAQLVGSEGTFDIREFQGGEWTLIHKSVRAHIVRAVTHGYFVCRNQSILCGDYRKRAQVVLFHLSCAVCTREYSFPKYGPSQLSINGYCSVICAQAAGIAFEEAIRQSEERMVYIGD